MTIEDKQDYTSSAVARLPNQFVNSTNLINVISISSDRLQGLNDEAIKILDGTSLSDSIGKQLENLATYLNLVREVGESDTDFRARILAETGVLSKSGEVEYIIDAFILAASASNAFYAEIYPAGFQIAAGVAVDAEDPDIDAAIISTMNNARAGGVSMILVISTETDYFMLDSSDNIDASGNGTSSAEHGLGSSTDVDGGQLARVLR